MAGERSRLGSRLCSGTVRRGDNHPSCAPSPGSPGPADACLRALVPAVVCGLDGNAYRFKAVGIELIRQNALPARLFTKTGDRKLVLVTRGGDLVRTPTGNHYQNNVVVTAVPIDS